MRTYTKAELAQEISMYGANNALDRLNPSEVPSELRLLWETTQTARRHYQEMILLIANQLREDF